MIHITTGQDAVLELLHKGVRRSVIARQLDKKRSAVYATVDRLMELGLVEREGNAFRRTDKPYVVGRRNSTAAVIPVQHHRPPAPETCVDITPQQAAYIRQHAGTKPRSQMARELGVHKVTLNLMIMQLRRSG